jgi:hypothetical protein
MVYKFKLSIFHFDTGLRFQETFYGIMKSAVYLQLSPLHRGPEFTYVYKVHGLVYFCYFINKQYITRRTIFSYVCATR